MLEEAVFKDDHTPPIASANEARAIVAIPSPEPAKSAPTYGVWLPHSNVWKEDAHGCPCHSSHPGIATQMAERHSRQTGQIAKVAIVPEKVDAPTEFYTPPAVS